MTRNELIEKLEAITLLEAEDLEDLNDIQLQDLVDEEYSILHLEEQDLNRYVAWSY